MGSLWVTDALLHHYWGQLSVTQPRVQAIGACPGAALWLSPEEESHTRMNIFASLDLGDGAGPHGGGGGAIVFTRLC